MSQLAYDVNPDLGFRGLLADPGMDKFAISLANGAAAAQGFGIGVRRDAVNPEEQFDILSAAGQGVAGILVHTQAREDFSLADPLGIALLETATLLRRGRLWVPIEEDVATTDSVFVRFATGSGTEIGAFRTDADGLPEVSTLTPVVVNSVVYTVDVKVGTADFHFETLSDGTATATEICDGMRAAMVLDATFTALVVASGTTTLILTGQTTGQELDVTSTGEGLFTIVETTPPAPTAELLPGASWLQGGTFATLPIALLEVNIP